MRPSRVFRLIFRIFIYLLTLSVTLISLFGGLSAILILQDFEENININTGDADFEFDLNETSGEIYNIAFSLPFNLTNAGYYDLENLQLTLQITVNYSEIDYPYPGVNGSKKVMVYDKFQKFGTIRSRQTRAYIFFGDFDDFLQENFPDYTTEVDKSGGPPILSFYANLTIKLDYSIGLHSLRFGVRDVYIGEYPGGVPL